MVNLVLIGRDERHVRLELAWSKRGDDFYTNVLQADLTGSVPGFRFEVLRQDLRAEELTQLRDGLSKLYQQLSGEARLTSLDEWIDLRFEGDGRGHIRVRGRLTDPAERSQDELTFVLNLDQTEISAIVDQIDDALQATG